MAKQELYIDTFICANTPKGFFTLQDELMDKNLVYIVKGGPGTGKSTFLKKIAAAFKRNGFDTELIHCSSDPASLDGVFVPAASLALFDGTPPHTAEPPLPGAGGGIINLGDFWNEIFLKDSREQIINLNREVNNCFGSAYSYLKAALIFKNFRADTAAKFTNHEKINKYALSVSQKLFKAKKGKKGKMTKRFLTAINQNGIVTYVNTISSLANNLYMINDPYFYAAPILLDKLNGFAIEAGLDTFVSYSIWQPDKIEFLIIPEISLCFASASDSVKLKAAPYMSISINRFTDIVSLKAFNNRLKLYRKLEKNLVSNAVAEFKKSKELHDELETYYIPSMNFKAVNEFEKNIETKLLSNVK